MAAHLGRVDVDAARVLGGYDDEGAAAALFGDDGHEFRIHGAERRIVRILRYLYILVADIFLVRISVDVPIL